MDELRLILLGIGLLIIGLIYAWGMRAQIKDRLQSRRREPGLDDSSEPSVTPVREAEAKAAFSQRTRPDHTPPKPSTPPVTEAAKPTTAAVPPPKAAPPEPTPTPPPSPPAESQASASEPASERVAKPQDTPAPVTTMESTQAVAEPSPPTATEAVVKPKPAGSTLRQTVAQAFASTKPSPPKTPPASKLTASKPPTWNVLLTLIAPEQQPYIGRTIKEAMEQQSMVLGKRGVWECLTGDGTEQVIFGVAHLREPGTFDPARLGSLRTPGLLLFMSLPGSLDAVTAVDLMVEQAGQLQRRLGGVLCDERRHRLTAQSLIQLRARADDFDRQMQAYYNNAAS